MAEVSRVDSKAGSIVESSIEVLKVRTAFMSILSIFCADLDLFAFAILFLLLVLCFKSSKLINTLVGLYLTLYRLILSTSAADLITFMLLACLKQQYQILIFRFLLTKCVPWPYPLNTIDWCVYFGVLSALLTFITFLEMARSKIKKFRLFLVCTIVFPSFINTIFIGLLWNMMPLSLNWPKNVKFELYSLANAMFWRLIWLVLRSIKTISTCFFLYYLACYYYKVYTY